MNQRQQIRALEKAFWNQHEQLVEAKEYIKILELQIQKRDGEI